MSVLSKALRGVRGERDRRVMRNPSVRPSAVRDALRPLKIATLGQLAAELAASPSEVEAALAFWENRGSVQKTRSLELSGCGSSCGGGCGGSGTSSRKVARRRKRLARRAARRAARARSAVNKRRSTAGRKPAGIVALYEWIGD